jgi:DNA-binding transcriptional ArsR family regulator
VSRFDAEFALRAIAHARRRQMLQLVWESERTSTELARRCRLSPPAASQHLKVLREAGLVSVRAEGNRRYYKARAERVAQVAALLDRFWGEKLARLQNELSTPKEDRP